MEKTIQKLLKAAFSWEFIKKALKFMLTSLSACLLNFGINIIGHECFGISVNILYPVSLAVVSCSTFLQCRFFVYPGASESNAMKQGWQFMLSTLVFRVLEWLFFWFLYNVVALSCHWWYVGCIIIVQCTGTVSKFFFYNFYVFGNRSEKSLEKAKSNLKN
ncbi:MAG: hypothetical protein J5858_05425 [Lentisphaeria bacterium]|nr:hypothetical protein [Lentisphaeria bacterium]